LYDQGRHRQLWNMKKHLNTLFVTREGAWLRKDGAAVEVRLEGETLLRVPLHNLDGIVAMGYDIAASAQLMAACAEAGVTLSFTSPNGKFMAAVRGFTQGNVLLRRAQYRIADDEPACADIAARMVAAKIANARTILVRAARERRDETALEQAIADLARQARAAHACRQLDPLRGIEGEAAGTWFGVLASLLQAPGFEFGGRVRRPPKDRVNALLSFCYSLLAHDCRSALESVGLDAGVGFLHRDRPGRPSLALDLMEEFRSVIADRCVLSLINRRQIQPNDFIDRETGAVELQEESRKRVLVAWQERKQEEIRHPFLDEKISYGLLPFIQARLLARAIRGDLDAYPAFLLKG